MDDPCVQTPLSHTHDHHGRGKRLPGPYNAWPFGFVWQIREWRKHNTWWIKSRELFMEHGPLIAFRVFCESWARLIDACVSHVCIVCIQWTHTIPPCLPAPCSL